MENIRFAEHGDIPKIIKLWDIAFGEEKDFNNYFFRSIFDVKKTLIYTTDDKLAAMTQMLDYDIKGFGAVTYIYGAATHPKLRGKGIMSKLLEESFKTDIKNNKAGSVLIPADEGLFDFYARFGYKKAFFIKKAEYTAAPAKISAVCENDIDFLNSIYEEKLRDIPHPVRTREYWYGQIKMFLSLGGYVYKNDSAYAFGYPDGIQELMGDNVHLLAAGIADKLCLDKIKAAEVGTKTPLGMLKPYGNEFDKMYFNLMFN